MLVRAEMEEVPTATVETLMASPLPKFIHFVANDCGYAATRFELVANWVHLLFLKTKSEASKEDNPTSEGSHLSTLYKSATLHSLDSQ